MRVRSSQAVYGVLRYQNFCPGGARIGAGKFRSYFEPGKAHCYERNFLVIKSYTYPQELLEGYRGQDASISLKDPPSPSPRPTPETVSLTMTLPHLNHSLPVVVAGRLCLYLPQIMSGCIQLAPSKGADEQPSRAPASGIDGKAIRQLSST